MDGELRDRVETAAERHALVNALKHGGEADVGAIMGPLMGENPAFRDHGDAIAGVVAPVVQRVNDLDRQAQRERLGDLDPDALADLDADVEADDHPLPDLPDAAAYDQVRMRCAPNPNGPWHIGHARMPAVIGTYKRRYDGWFCVRFDDTDPETKRPDLAAYDAILETVAYLGFEPDAVYRASDRLEVYYDHARRLIDAGGAYTCDLSAERFSELKNAGEPSPNRDKDPDTVREEFDGMVAGEYDAGDLVLRVRTDITHKNPAVRDWVAFRMVDMPHPRAAASAYRCWPLLDFQSAIDDHELGITHIIRGIDLQDSAKRQRYLYDYFGWTYPEVIHWGHVHVDAFDLPLSTSSLRAMIEVGDLEGWDDPRAPTLASLRRRGIRGSAVVDAMVDLGTSTSNVELSMSAIYAANREAIDASANRYFFVGDGMRVPIDGDPRVATPPLHPDDPDRGTREIPVDDAVSVPAEDLPAAGERVWLKGYGPVRYDGAGFTPTDDDIDVVREGAVPVIHWVPADGPAVVVRRPSGDVSGRGEPAVAGLEPDTVVQFERVGFARIDAQDDGTVAYFAHR